MKVLALLALLAGCATAARTARDPQFAFLGNLETMCGRAFAGRVVSTDAADADMTGKRLVMHVRECDAARVRIPFHVGEDRSRTWVFDLPMSGGLRLKHDHRHADGSADVLTQYGGDSAGGGTARRQTFPADDFSKALFVSKGNPASVANVWAVEIVPGRTFAYELRRPNRFFRVEFDLTRPVPAPPPPWGAR